MCHVSRHWLTGSVLALMLVGAGPFVPSLPAQSPFVGSPLPGAVPLPGGGGPVAPDVGSAPVPGDVPGLPASRQGPSGIQRQGDLLRLTRNVPGDAKPIVLEADEVHTWTEGGLDVFLLQGKVLAQQSAVQTRCQQAIVWVDRERYRTTGIWHVDLY